MMGMSGRLKKLSRYSTLSIVIIVFIAFLGQTTNTTTYNINLTPVVNLLTTLLPLFISIMVIVLIFKFVGSIFEGFERWVKQAKLYVVRFTPFITSVIFVAQTTTNTSAITIDLTPVTNLLVALLPVFISIMVLVLIFKFIGSIFEGFTRWIRQAKIYAVRYAPKLMTIAFVFIIVFLGQTSSSSTIDLTPIVNLLMALLPVIMSLLVIVLIFRLVGGIFESFGSVFKQQVKIKAALRSAFIRTVPILILLGQTATGVDQAQQVVAQLTPILMTLITIVMLIAIPILVFKVLAKSVIDIIRG
jgi:hypothetical protein